MNWLSYSRLAFLGVIAVTLLSFACGGGQQEVPTVELRPVSISLSELLEVAEVFPHAASQEKIPLSDDRIFSGGWHQWQRLGDEEYRWTIERSASIDFGLSRKDELILHLAVAPLEKDKRLIDQSLYFEWNGESIGEVTLRWETQDVVLKIPKQLQLFGSNRLTLKPAYWIVPIKLGIGIDEHALGVKVSGVYFESEAPVGVYNIESLASAIEEQSILQQPNSSISYYLHLKLEPKLHTAIKLHNALAQDGEELEGNVRVSIRSEYGTEQILAEMNISDPRLREELPLDLDLSSYAGHFVELTLSASIQGEVWNSVHDDEGRSRPAIELEWRRPIITYEKEVVLDQSPKDFRGKYNVMIVLLDAMRSDHIEPYDRGQAATPTMMELSRRGTTFLNTSSTASWTRPSVASLLTSTPSGIHGALELTDSLSPSVTTLSEVLTDHGYHTILISNNAQISTYFGFDRGFKSTHEFFRLREQMTKEYRTPEAQAEYVWEKYIAPALPSITNKPFFVYLHEVDPHAPYEPPSPYDELYPHRYPGRMTTAGNVISHMRFGHTPVMPADVNHMIALYNGEISFMDAYLGWIRKKLVETGLDKDTLFILLSDHGEEFYDHQGMGHGGHLYEETIHIPNIWVLEDVIPSGHRPRVLTSIMDIAPTILDLVEGDVPPSMMGKSMIPYMFQDDEYFPDAEVHARLTTEQRSVRFRNWKLIMRTKRNVTFELYDLNADPNEQVNLWTEEVVIGKALRQLIRLEILGETPKESSSLTMEAIEQADPEIVERLRALGYLD